MVTGVELTRVTVEVTGQVVVVILTDNFSMISSCYKDMLT